MIDRNILSLASCRHFVFGILLTVVLSPALTLAQDGGGGSEPLADIEALGVQKDQAVLAVQQACPGPWESLTDEVLPPADDIVPWVDTGTDRAAFLTYLEEGQLSDSPDDREQMTDDLNFVSNECIAQRVRLFGVLTKDLPRDVISAITQLDQPDALFTSAADGFEVGDIRTTSRKTPANGWVFLHGQSIGSTDSYAGYRGDDLKELYEIAMYWEPNTGLESWEAGDIVRLPDLRDQLSQNESISYEGIPGSVAAVAINREIKYTKRPTHPLVFDPILKTQRIFEYTGDDQLFTIPAGVTEITVQAWGAGGSGGIRNYPAGNGGYASAVVEVSSGQKYTVVVGQGGIHDRQSVGYGGGGPVVAPCFSTNGYGMSGGTGGGLSGLFLGDQAMSWDPVGQARAVVVAGGGGGGNGGDGGGEIGQEGMPDSTKVGGQGGGQDEGGAPSVRGSNIYAPGNDGAWTRVDVTADATSGLALVGGKGGKHHVYGDWNGSAGGGTWNCHTSGPGGGGGYYGGGGGMMGTYGAGGGSSYIADGLIGEVMQGLHASAEHYVAPAGEPEQHGLIVIEYVEQ